MRGATLTSRVRARVNLVSTFFTHFFVLRARVIFKFVLPGLESPVIDLSRSWVTLEF